MNGITFMLKDYAHLQKLEELLRGKAWCPKDTSFIIDAVGRYMFPEQYSSTPGEESTAYGALTILNSFEPMGDGTNDRFALRLICEVRDKVKLHIGSEYDYQVSEGLKVESIAEYEKEFTAFARYVEKVAPIKTKADDEVVQGTTAVC